MNPSSSPQDAFVGRKAEMSAWENVLTNPDGQVVLVVGQQGMGKSILLKRMASIAGSHPCLKCSHVIYEATRTDAPDTTMAQMLDDAWHVADVTQKSFDATPKRLEQWRSFLNIFNIGDLVLSLRRDSQLSTRSQFLAALEKISGRISSNDRLLLIVDPEKYMPDGSADTWRIVTKNLPDKVKLVFAQRPDGQLISNADFMRLNNIVLVPQNKLQEFDDSEVDELISLRQSYINHPTIVIKDAMLKYNGHPYALGAALSLLASGSAPDELPSDPIGLAAEQWKRAFDIGGEDAWRLMTAHAILEVSVPEDVALEVSQLEADDIRAFRQNTYLNSMLRDEPNGTRLYHILLQDYRINQLKQEEAKNWHRIAVAAYKYRLQKHDNLDAFSALRLPEHVLKAEGNQEFINCICQKCHHTLDTLGLIDELIGLYRRALELVEPQSQLEAAVLTNLGGIFQARGALNEAEEVLKKAEVTERQNNKGDSLVICLANLGILYRSRGNFEQAVSYLNEALEISEGFKWHKGIALASGNLGPIFRRKKQYDVAATMHQKALEASRHGKNRQSEAQQYADLGLIHLEKGEYEQAEINFQSAMNINLELKNIQGYSKDYFNLGILRLRRNRNKHDLEESEKLIKQSLEYEEKLGRLENITWCYDNLGIIYYIRRDYETAEEYLQKSKKLCEDKQFKEGLAGACANLGGINAERGRRQKARELWNQAEDLFVQLELHDKARLIRAWLDSLPDEQDS